MYIYLFLFLSYNFVCIFLFSSTQNLYEVVLVLKLTHAMNEWCTFRGCEWLKITKHAQLSDVACKYLEVYNHWGFRSCSHYGYWTKDVNLTFGVMDFTFDVLAHSYSQYFRLLNTRWHFCKRMIYCFQIIHGHWRSNVVNLSFK